MTLETQSPTDNSALSRVLAASTGVDREKLAWGLLLIGAVLTRFWDLGLRAMSHDEAQHAIYSFYLYDTGNYQHDPLLHGPLLFHLNALFYSLFGASDFSARLAPALSGLGVILLIACFRRYIGRTGALAAALLVVLSPTLLCYSRYIRNDVYIALFVMVWIYAAFRYLETRGPRWLWLMVAAMALAFTTKENSFIFGATIGAFFGLLALGRLLSPGLRSERRASQNSLDRAALQLSLLMLTLVLPFMTPWGYFITGRDLAGYAQSENLWHNLLLLGLATLLSGLLATTFFGLKRGAEGISLRLWVKLMALFWGVQILLFTTFFTNTQKGLVSGVVGSLGYWLTQHEVGRGSQPWFYYLILSAVYEFLALFLCIAACWSLNRHLKTNVWEPVSKEDLPVEAEPGAADVDASEIRKLFLCFLAFWVLCSWIGYSVAGERMPWLLMHVVLPMCVLGGWWLGRLLNLISWRSVTNNRGFSLILVPGLTGLLTLALLRGGLFEGRDLLSLAATSRWLVTLGVLLLLIYLASRVAHRVGRTLTFHLLALGVVSLLGLLTFRASLMLNFKNYDLASELLVYAHGTPDIKQALDEIDLIGSRTGGISKLAVAYDSQSSWPFTWYMRDYPGSKFYGDAPRLDAMKAPVVIVGPDNLPKVLPYLTDEYIRRVYRLIWWPPHEPYLVDLKGFFKTVTDPVSLRNLSQYFFYRRLPGVDMALWSHRQEFNLFVRRDIASDVWNLGVDPSRLPASDLGTAEQMELQIVRSFSGDYAGLPLSKPRDLAVSPQGDLVIADSGNNRILILDKGGNLKLAFGSTCILEKGPESGCLDPDGSQPGELGDGQFNEPWGVGVNQQGEIYVADTWNGRIQKFDSEGQFQAKWGRFGHSPAELRDPKLLFGPRGLTLDLEGNLLVADTGNKRILRFAAGGAFLSQVGGGGITPGLFDEPVSLVVEPGGGAVYVSDAWNRRIQKFDAGLQFQSEWKVPGWKDQGILSKPYIALDSAGQVYVTDPENSRILVYAVDGSLRARLSGGTGTGQFLNNPNGLALDPTKGNLLVADGGNDRILEFTPVKN